MFSLFYVLLAYKCYTYLVDFTTERRSNLRHGALHLNNLWKLLAYRLDDVRCRSLDGALCALHGALHNGKYGEVVHRLGNIIRLREVTQRCTYCEIYAKAVAHLLLQVVAAVERTDVDAVKAYGI